MSLKAIKGGWINTDFDNEYQTIGTQMITQERKSKYKHKITVKGVGTLEGDMREWCRQSFGPGGRSKTMRWRFGWTQNDSTFYFKSSKDAMMFTLRWSS